MSAKLGVMLTGILIFLALTVFSVTPQEQLVIENMTIQSMSAENHFSSSSKSSWYVTNPTKQDIFVQHGEYEIVIANASKPIAVVEIPEFEVRKWSRNQHILTQHIFWEKDQFAQLLNSTPDTPVTISGQFVTANSNVPFTLETNLRECFYTFFANNDNRTLGQEIIGFT